MLHYNTLESLVSDKHPNVLDPSGEELVPGLLNLLLLITIRVHVIFLARKLKGVTWADFSA